MRELNFGLLRLLTTDNSGQGRDRLGRAERRRPRATLSGYDGNSFHAMGSQPARFLGRLQPKTGSVATRRGQSRMSREDVQKGGSEDKSRGYQSLPDILYTFIYL